MKNPIVEVLRVGTFQDNGGASHTFTAADLDKIAASYDPSHHEAPVTVGHPEDNTPAYGWVKRAFTEGTKLFLELKDVIPEFMDAWKKGMYKKRSISLYPDMTIRHLAFLGGTPPAVKGLANFAFTEKEMASIDYGEVESSPNFSEPDSGKTAQDARSKEYNISVKDGGNITKPSKYSGLDDAQFADPVNYRYPIDAEHIHAALSYWGMPDNRSGYSEEERKIITRRMLAAAKKNNIEIDKTKWNFSEPQQGADMDLQQALARIAVLEQEAAGAKSEIADFSDKVNAAQTQITVLTAENAALTAKITGQETAARKIEFTSFCENLVKEGRMLPKMKYITISQLERAYQASTGQFAEGQVKPVDELKEALKACPRIIEFGEHARKGANEVTGTSGEKLNILTQKKMSDNKDMNFSEAFRQVQIENPELAAEYADEKK